MASVTSLDHDMRKLRLERYTPAAASEAKAWIEETLGERLEGDLLSAIRDGVALCKLVNLALPPPGIKFKSSNMPFTQRENISHFLTACENPPFNLPSHDRFLTVDLYDEKDPAQVIQCLGAFSRVANAINPSRFPNVIGPRRGAPSPTRKIADGGSYSTTTPSRPSRGFSDASQASNEPAKSPPTSRMMSPSLTGGSASSKTPESTTRSPPGQISSWSKKSDQLGTAPAWNIHQYGYMGGASQGNQGVVFGAPRQITSPSVQVPSTAEKEKRLKQQQQMEVEREAQRRREEEQQKEMERRAQQEAEEEQAKREEQRRWEEETRKAKLREQEEAERQRLETEREREELRRAREEELRAVERDKEERRKFELRRKAEEEVARKVADARHTILQSGQSEADRIAELERRLDEAEERERQFLRNQQTQQQTLPKSQAHKPPEPTSDSTDKQNIPEAKPLQPTRSGGPRPLPNPASKPAPAPKPRAYPFTRPTKPLDSPKAEPQPPPPPRATADPPSDDTNPSQYSSARPPHVTRTDQYLALNPAPAEEKPASHFPQEMGMTSTSEREAEDSRREAAQQKTKAGGWASKSLLEREMERERERQREWEETQMAKARASGQSLNSRGIMGPRAMNSK